MVVAQRHVASNACKLKQLVPSDAFAAPLSIELKPVEPCTDGPHSRCYCGPQGHGAKVRLRLDAIAFACRDQRCLRKRGVERRGETHCKSDVYHAPGKSANVSSLRVTTRLSYKKEGGAARSRIIWRLEMDRCAAGATWRAMEPPLRLPSFPNIARRGISARLSRDLVASAEFTFGGRSYSGGRQQARSVGHRISCAFWSSDQE